MDALQKKLQEMESLGHSPIRYKERTLGERVLSAGRGLYHPNQLKNRGSDNVIEIVPQKESILAEDVIYKIISSGKSNLEILSLYSAESDIKRAIDLNARFKTGYEAGLGDLSKSVVQAYINRATSQAEKGSLYDAEQNHGFARITAKELGVNLREQLSQLKNMIDKKVQFRYSH